MNVKALSFLFLAGLLISVFPGQSFAQLKPSRTFTECTYREPACVGSCLATDSAGVNFCGALSKYCPLKLNAIDKCYSDKKVLFDACINTCKIVFGNCDAVPLPPAASCEARREIHLQYCGTKDPYCEWCKTIKGQTYCGMPPMPDPCRTHAEEAYQACAGIIKPKCDDQRDNDRDGRIDLNDPGCENAADNDETNTDGCVGEHCGDRGF